MTDSLSNSNSNSTFNSVVRVSTPDSPLSLPLLAENELGEEGFAVLCDWLITNSSVKVLGLGSKCVEEREWTLE